MSRELNEALAAAGQPLRRAALLALSIGLLVGDGAALAEEYDFDVDAQRTDGSLMEIAETGDVQVMFAPEPVRKNQSPEVRGTLSVDSALDTSLSDSNLSYEFKSEDFVVITENEDGDKVTHAVNTSSVSPVLLAQLQDESLRDSLAGSLESSDEATGDLDVIVVTGTRLKGIDPASPRIEITREDIERGGYASVEDVLRNLPQNLGSASSLSNQLGQIEFGADASRALLDPTLGASGINLRGLGTRSSLVLVNGRRKARSSLGVQDLLTDTSSIPLAQVERIEIITDGASAIYGADAVAGVVNIILRDDYEGLSLGFRAEDATNGATRNRLDLGTTGSWSSGYITLSANIEETEPNDPNKLTPVGPNGIGDFTALGGLDLRSYGVGPAGQGSVVAVVPGSFGSVFSGEVVAGPDPYYPRDPVTGEILGPREAGVPSLYRERDLGPEASRYSFRLNGEQRLGESHALGFEFSYDSQEDDNTLSFNTINFNNTNPGRARGSLVTANRERLNGLLGSYFFITATNPSNPYGQDVFVGYDMVAESELVAAQALPVASDLENTAARISLTGGLPFGDWSYDISGSMSREESNTRNYQADFFDDASAAAIAEQFDPFSGTATEANAALLTAPLDILMSDGSNETYQYTASFTGSLFDMPAGAVKMAIGFERRDSEGESISLNTNFDGSPVLDPFTLEPQGPTTIGPNEEKVESYFAEVAFPIVKDKPGFKELTITAAARYEDYDRSGFVFAVNFDGVDTVDGINLVDLVGAQTAGTVGFAEDLAETAQYDNTSPSFGLTWRLTDSFAFKATHGESFLTPLSSQLFGGVSINNSTGNPFLLGVYEPIGGVYGSPAGQIYSLSGSNPALLPQTAETTTLTLEWSPRMIEGLDLAAVWSDIAYDNFIANPTFALDTAELVANFDRLPQIFILGDTNSLVYDTRELNLSSNISETLDLRADYRFSTDIGNWGIHLNAVRTYRTERQLVDFIPAVDISDTERGPSDWAAQLRLNWDLGEWSATWDTHYVSGTRMLEPASASSIIPTDAFRREDELPLNANPQTETGSYTRTDVQVGWRSSNESGWTSGLRAALGVQNLFEPDPPFVDNSSGYAANRVFPSGRVIYLNLNKDFSY